MSDYTNVAYIDAQNLHLGTTKHPDSPWQIDLKRFRVYLQEKYKVEHAYYWLGYIEDGHDSLYDEIQKAGFILKFREHNSTLKSAKKGNVDTEIVFDVMYALYRRETKGKVVLVSGDGDYYRMVQFLFDEEKLEKILFPNARRASSLYNKKMRTLFCSDLSELDLRKKIMRKKKRAT